MARCTSTPRRSATLCSATPPAPSLPLATPAPQAPARCWNAARVGQISRARWSMASPTASSWRARWTVSLAATRSGRAMSQRRLRGRRRRIRQRACGWTSSSRRSPTARRARPPRSSPQRCWTAARACAPPSIIRTQPACACSRRPCASSATPLRRSPPRRISRRACSAPSASARARRRAGRRRTGRPRRAGPRWRRSCPPSAPSPTARRRRAGQSRRVLALDDG
mmetsp:Transcript_8035/g.22940  ORF Transcript_8035/g.22940 Transcript_8035/m.22940 type:complete len:225 (+) Transcript_8035:759-1433(+)